MVSQPLGAEKEIYSHIGGWWCAAGMISLGLPFRYTLLSCGVNRNLTLSCQAAGSSAKKRGNLGKTMDKCSKGEVDVCSISEQVKRIVSD